MKSSFSRFFSTALVLLLLALLLVGGSFRLLVENYMEDSAVESLRSDAQVISGLASVYISDDSLNTMEFLMNLDVASQVSGADAVICDSDGRIILCSDSPRGCNHQGMVVNGEYLQRVAREGSTLDTTTIEHLYEDNRYVVSMPIVDSSGVFQGIVMVSTPTASTQEVLTKISDIFLFVSLLVVLACAVLMTIFARQQSAPLRAMAKAAYNFGHGDLTARVKTDGKNAEEVEELALAFNNMASSLQKSEYQRQEFVANVSHELKTPMTTIAGYIDGILDGTIPESRREHYLQIVSDETKRLSRLVRSMLDISQLQNQGGIPEEKKTVFDLEEAMGQVLITFERKITDKMLDVQVEMPEHPVYTRANADYVTQVIYNLVDNAVKFSPQGGQLGLTLREGTAKVYISISNQGDTIPPEELPLVFDRFHKIDKSRSQNREGWGLGLYIVKTIVCSHGEDISVASRDGKTTFTFTMPLVN